MNKLPVSLVSAWRRPSGVGGVVGCGLSTGTLARLSPGLRLGPLGLNALPLEDGTLTGEMGKRTGLMLILMLSGLISRSSAPPSVLRDGLAGGLITLT